MTTSRKEFVIVIVFLIGLSTCMDCDFTFRNGQIDQPKTVEFLFPAHVNKLNICFKLRQHKTDQVYLLRLDYFPFHCLSAKNDAKMEWNEELQHFQTQIAVERSCKKRTLLDNQEESYPLVFQFRKGYDKGGILAHNQLVHRYLPSLGVIFLISLLLQRIVFRSITHSKDKSK